MKDVNSLLCFSSAYIKDTAVCWQRFQATLFGNCCGNTSIKGTEKCFQRRLSLNCVMITYWWEFQTHITGVINLKICLLF